MKTAEDEAFEEIAKKQINISVAQPTTKFRYVEKTVDISSYNIHEIEVHRILQQWWERKIWAHDDWIVIDGEWRNIPIERE